MDAIDPKKLLAEYENAASRMDAILTEDLSLAQVAGMPDRDMEAIFTSGQNALQLEDYGKAEQIFGAMLYLNHKDTRAALGLAGALEGQRRYESAVPFYFMVLATTLFDPVAPFRAGVCLMNLGKKEDALDHFKLAAACKNENREAAKQIYIEKAEGFINLLSA
ncbi:MAG: hypothetical protein MI747_03605 [Desulfobacterales bacterium]|nr:hypothetical protein [Desulfobacterales bacterium]